MKSFMKCHNSNARMENYSGEILLSTLERLRIEWDLTG